MNNPDIFIFDHVVVLFQKTYKIVVKVCQSFGNSFSGQVEKSECPQIHKGDIITFGNKMIVQ